MIPIEWREVEVADTIRGEVVAYLGEKDKALLYEGVDSLMRARGLGLRAKPLIWRQRLLGYTDIGSWSIERHYELTGDRPGWYWQASWSLFGKDPTTKYNADSLEEAKAFAEREWARLVGEFYDTPANFS